MPVKIFDLQKQDEIAKKEIYLAIKKVLNSQQYILGEETDRFEKDYARFCGKKYCVAVGSGSDALLVALLALGFQAGDEVVVPDYTFIATAEVVTLLHGKVVFCDVDPQTGLLDLKDLERKISTKTKFIIPVHLYGQIAPIKEINKLVKRFQIQLIEDAAQAHGATYRKKMAPIGGIATYSFYPAKNLGAYGDGGAVVTDNRKLANKIRLLRNHGQKIGEKYFHHLIGYNFRMNEIQAAILNVKLKYLANWVRERRRLARFYDRALNKIEAIEILRTLPDNGHAYHLYGIKVKARDKLKAFLEKCQIETRIHYPLPLHLQPAYKYLGFSKGDFKGAETLAKEILCLPLYPGLTQKELLQVIRAIKHFFT